MEYTTKKLSELAGVSSRTLRYYDEIGLLKPGRVNSSGYRIYGEKEVDALQQILFYRAMEMKLEGIQEIISRPDFDIPTALVVHHQRLVSKRDQLNQLISTIEKTISYNKGETIMTDKDKFEGLKKEKLAENEASYGKEIREKYGDKTVEASNKKFGKLSVEDYKKMQEVESEMFVALGEVVRTKDLESEAAKKVYDKHRAWLSFTWPEYSKESHLGLAEMYVADERFARYYSDRGEKDTVGVLRDIIVKYAI